jgi:hypothetical protein
VPHNIGDEANGDKSCTLFKSNTNTKICGGKHNVLSNPNLHKLMLFIEKRQLYKMEGFRFVRVKLLLLKQHLKHKNVLNSSKNGCCIKG